MVKLIPSAGIVARSPLANRPHIPATPFPLLKFPVDILSLILELLSTTERLHVALSSRDLYRFTLPYVYANVHLEWHWSYPPCYLLFLQALTRKPSLAMLVRSLTLTGRALQDEDPSFIRTRNSTTLPTVEPLQEIVRRLEKIDIFSREAWGEGKFAESTDIYVALLLSRLPNLAYLRLDPRYTRQSNHIGNVLRSILCCEPGQKPHHFQQLRDVTFVCDTGDHEDLWDVGDWWRSRYCRNTGDVLPLFYLPSIERLAVTLDNPVSFKWPAMQNRPPIAARLTHLELTAPFREDYLGQILATVPRLTTLHWNWYHHDQVWQLGHHHVIDLDRIAEALSCVRATLTELVITAYSGEENDWQEVRSTGSLTNLSRLLRLTTLQIPWVFLMGWSSENPAWGLQAVLPESLEVLTVTMHMWELPEYEWVWKPIFAVFSAWLEDWRRGTPKLRSLIVDFRGTIFETIWPHDVDKLRALCHQVGLKMRAVDSYEILRDNLL